MSKKFALGPVEMKLELGFACHGGKYEASAIRVPQFARHPDTPMIMATQYSKTDGD